MNNQLFFETEYFSKNVYIIIFLYKHGKHFYIFLNLIILMITRNIAIHLFFVFSLSLVGTLFGTIVVAVNDHTVYAFENATSYNFIEKWGGAGSDDGQFLRPHDLDFNKEETILYIVDRDGSRIQAFDKDGNFLFKFGEDGTGDGQMHVPYGIDIDTKGNVWLADRANDRVQEFDSKGNFILKFGSENGVPSAEEGKFDNPRHVAVSKD